MKDEQIKEIMALVDRLAYCNYGFGFEVAKPGKTVESTILENKAEQLRTAIESALRAAVPAIPEPLGCLHINRGSADAEADEYAAEYFAQLAQGKADADLRRGALQTVGYYVRDAMRRYQASPQAPQVAQPTGASLNTEAKGPRSGPAGAQS
jgi:hypothetical protein